MNILILSEKYPPDVGGLAVSTRRLAHGLARAGHRVCVSAPSGAIAPGSAACADDDGLPLYRVGAQHRADDLLSVWFDHVLAWHALQAFDVIHAMYLTAPAFVAVAAANYLGCASVVSARGNDLDRTAFDPGRFAQIAWALEHAGAVTAVTSDLARKARAFAPGRAVRVVRNGVDCSLFTPGARDEPLAGRLGLQGRVVAFVGEARQKKGLAVLLLAFAELCATFTPPAPAPSLLLVGDVRKDDAPMLDVFRRQNPALHVCVVPSVAHEDLPAYYRLADVLAVPSLRDGMPNALLEGMACARAVVASRAGGIPDVLAGGGDGLLVPPGDAHALAGALRALLCDDERRQRMGRAARAAVEAGFTPQQEAQANVQLYREVLGANP